MPPTDIIYRVDLMDLMDKPFRCFMTTGGYFCSFCLCSVGDPAYRSTFSIHYASINVIEYKTCDVKYGNNPIGASQEIQRRTGNAAIARHPNQYRAA